ncbi:pyridoxamine 5'-phosphate oxidase family protein [Actinobacteria bacterium YIM 96077]|uniref:Pyridoxamine 5'-phosphate oxidase family protein n=1 Tax=Phytoactinopolyspora halophila TaxID=1981511 RepID=A0A329QMA8_9ACTN|nr:pyridoxamine 5'-phosphate oxidase family protein [Phytoactinopolyspora halophila]AYY15410.1 pyridoxamine 5'-phosphate oxidase family protein [Actinobacteria bacterium YIM 96077]RAW13296.1 pyridoxamine 5'-phosphate oxidase family protein [Phytoactinopolyspora halophila]
MSAVTPRAEVDTRFSMPGATAPPWEDVQDIVENAELYWISTVHPEGRPHVTPLLAVWVDDALYFCTGPEERKAKNLALNPECVLTTGRNELNDGIDVVVEGSAVRVDDDAKLQRLAVTYEAKYGPGWRFEARDGLFHHSSGAGHALVFEVAPVTVFGFRKGEYSQTKYRF